MTNTNYIGGVKSFSNNDKLTPYKGYKVVGLKVPKGDEKLEIVGPHYYAVPYGVSADSTCKKGAKCDFSTCSCGFYSYADVNSALRHWAKECGGNANLPMIQVALSQKVVICENGYRASHQRIARILMPHCWNCSNAGTYMVAHESGLFVTGCDSCMDKFPKIKESSLQFKDFAEKYSPEGSAVMEIYSAADLGKEAQKLLNPEHLFDKAMEAIKDLVDAKDIFALQTLAGEIKNSTDSLVSSAFNEVMK